MNTRAARRSQSKQARYNIQKKLNSTLYPKWIINISMTTYFIKDSWPKFNRIRIKIRQTLIVRNWPRLIIYSWVSAKWMILFLTCTIKHRVANVVWHNDSDYFLLLNFSIKRPQKLPINHCTSQNKRTHVLCVSVQIRKHMDDKSRANRTCFHLL